MKNDTYIQSLNKIEPDEAAQERMLRQILSRARYERAQTERVQSIKTQSGRVQPKKTQSGKIQPRKVNSMNQIVKWLTPVAACLVIALAATLAVPNLFPPAPNPSGGIIIVGTEMDNSGAISEDYRVPDYISPMLQNAINSAKPGDRIKTVVLAPGFWDYLYAFEIDGTTYWELYEYWASGILSDEHDRGYSEALYKQLEAVKALAAAAFFEKAVSELGIIDAEFNFSGGYPTFVAILYPEKILSLEQAKCFMRLWSPAELDNLVITNEDTLIAMNE